MPTPHASLAAAVTAGFKSVATDRGAGHLPASERWEVTVEKHIVGGLGRRGGLMRAYGVGSSQAAAETRALAALEEQRSWRYGRAAAGGSISHDGAALAVDVA